MAPTKPPKSQETPAGKSSCGNCNAVDTEEMVLCEKCDRWFHFDCVGVDQTIEDKEWSCTLCAAMEQPPTKEVILAPKLQHSPLKEIAATRSQTTSSKKADIKQVMKSLEDSEKLNEQLLGNIEELSQRLVEKQEAELSLMKRLEDLEKAVAQQSIDDKGGAIQELNVESEENATAIDGDGEDDDTSSRLLFLEQKRAERLERVSSLLSPIARSPVNKAINVSSPSTPLAQESGKNPPSIDDSNAIAKLAISVNRPYLRKLPHFDGKEKEWPVFITLYESTTKEGNFSESDNIARLREALKGEALKHVLSKLRYSNDATSVIEALRKAYGRPDRLIVKLTEELLEVTPMKSETDIALREFAMAATEYVTSLEVLERSADLKNEFVLEKLVEKLHFSHYRKWDKLKKAKTDINLRDFADFLQKKVEEIPPAMFSTHSARSEKKQSNGSVNTHEVSSGSHNDVAPCPLCNDRHKLWRCKDFKKLSVDERWRVVTSKKVCALCLSSTRHSIKDCTYKVKCGFNGCEKNHHLLLHKQFVSNRGNSRNSQNRDGNSGGHNSVGHNSVGHNSGGHNSVGHNSGGHNSGGHNSVGHNSGGNSGGHNSDVRSSASSGGNRQSDTQQASGLVNLNANANAFERSRDTQSQSGTDQRCNPVMTLAHCNDVIYKVIPVILKRPNSSKAIKTFAFLDGGSSLTLLDASLYDELQLEGTSEELCIKWTGGIRRKEASQRTSLEISGINSRKTFTMINVHTAKDLDLPVQSIDAKRLQERYRHLRNIQIPSFDKSRPKILIGLKHARLMASEKTRVGGENDPIANKTPLGWTVYGANLPSLGFKSDINSSSPAGFQLSMQEVLQDDLELHNIVKEHFTTENFGVVPLKEDLIGAEHKRANEIMSKTMRNIGNRYEIGLLWKSDDVKLPDSLPMALKRLESEERSLRRRGLLEWKNKFIKELVEKQHARLARPEELRRNWARVWYCPTFVVVNQNKFPPKPRNVADVAAKVKGVSLNSFLLPGPNNIAPLMRGLLIVREHAVAINADVKEMFPQIRIIEEDQHCQRFLWRDGDNTRAPETYVMQAMMFGPNCSPSCSQFVKNTHAEMYRDQYPEAAEALIKNTYVDDYFNSHPTVEEAIRVSNDAIKICEKMGFELVGFQSNKREIMELLPKTNIKAALVSLDCRETESYMTKILGMYWQAFPDFFTFKITYDEILKRMMNPSYLPTKREILKVVMRIFDPLGLIALFTIRGKIVMQEVWRDGTDWDDKISTLLAPRWYEFISHLPDIEKLVIPRRYAPVNLNECDIDLVVFVDASEQAYAATAYARIDSRDGKVFVGHIMGKSRVAPVKRLTIPQLELQSAVLGVRLAKTIKELHSIKFKRSFFMSDSKTVLSWITSLEYRFKTFVAIRIGEILENSSRLEWNKVPTKENVADDATKWKSPEMGGSKMRWFVGPEFLKLPVENWPVTPAVEIKEDEEIVAHSSLLLHAASIETDRKFTIIDEISARFRTFWPSFVRVIAFILRFVNKTRQKSTVNQKFITPEEFRKAELLVFRKIQIDSYPQEVSVMSSEADTSCKTATDDKAIFKSSSINSLCPVMLDNVIRASTRAQLAKSTFASQNPVILPNKHPLVDVFVRFYHEKNFHLGEDTTIGDIRQVAWIVDIRTALRRIISQCQWCKNQRAKPKSPMMGLLPEPRLAFDEKAFTHVGIDAFGPYLVKFGRGSTKRYGLIFTCLSFRAVHIELLRDMSTPQVMMAIRRMLSSRGPARTFYSDNGKNFVGAANTLHKDLCALKHFVTEEAAKSYHIEWKFMPAYSPWFGGAWERLIQSVKKCVDFILKGEIAHDDVLETALKDASFLMNRRPLTHVPISHEDSKPLTPNTAMFGNDDENSALAPGVFTSNDAVSSSSYRRAQHLTTKFMSRWVREYLPEIYRREKWNTRNRSIKMDDIVIVTETNEPRDAWKKGRVIKLHQGPDKIVRAVDVKMSDGSVRLSRAVGRVAVLDVKEETAAGDPTSVTGGGMSPSDPSSSKQN